MSATSAVWPEIQAAIEKSKRDLKLGGENVTKRVLEAKGQVISTNPFHSIYSLKVGPNSVDFAYSNQIGDIFYQVTISRGGSQLRL